LTVFFLGTPALANLPLLRTQPKKWFIVLPFCVAFAFVLMLLQYGVSERLYGINGDDGPYST
jgi:cobalamin synthase